VFMLWFSGQQAASVPQCAVYRACMHVKIYGQRWLTAIAVLLVHALWVGAWWQGPAFKPQRDALQRQTPMQWRDVPAVVMVAVPPSLSSSAQTSAERAVKPAARQAPQRAPTPAAIGRPTVNAAPAQPSLPALASPSSNEPAPPATAAAALQPDAAASAPLNLRLQANPGMTGRGSLTEPQGSVRQLALNDPRSNVRVDPLQKLPDAVAEAGKGDCMKGEFSGAGMGLLSAPFLAAAALLDKCKPQR
jgi:hypothetical protein